MAPTRLRTKTKTKNHKLVVQVRAPRTCSSRRYRERMRQKKAERGQNLDFLDFPADLVANMLEGLSSADRIRFGATCKTNLSLVTSTKATTNRQYQFRAIDKLPWLVQLNCDCPKMKNITLEFSLFDPLHLQGQPNYATYKIKDPKGEGFGSWDFTELKASNKGWLLCLWSNQGEAKKETGLTSFLLFSPFNKRIIKLPDLSHDFDNKWTDLVHCKATFSSDPSSPDSVYFFLSQNSIPGKFSISTLDQTSKEWKTIVVDKQIEYVSSVVYHEGCFYCLSSKMQLAAYNVVHHSWEVIIPTCPLTNLGSAMRSTNTFMVECEGKVILVVLDTKPLEYKVEMNSCGVFEFSSSTRTWVKKTSLGNHALFLGDTSFSAPVSSTSTSNNIADRVYFYSFLSNRDLSPFYYSLKDGLCHPSKDGGYWSSDVKGGVWIEPPSLTGSPSGLLLEESVY